MNTFEGFGITVRETPSDVSELAIHSIPVDRVLEDLDVSVYAVAAPHGMMPSVAFRVDHAKPSAVGYTAQQSAAKRLLLSHLMPPIESDLTDSLAIVRRAYDGPIEVASDLKEYQIGA